MMESMTKAPRQIGQILKIHRLALGRCHVAMKLFFHVTTGYIRNYDMILFKNESKLLKYFGD